MPTTKPLRDITHQFDLDHNRLSAREREILTKNRRPNPALHWLQGGLVGVITTSLASLLIPHPGLNFLLEKRHG